ncbi:lactadherin-like [Branchiostoma floridae]|uniref:Lactadherin-like n=2 Tax=Branchiostoma floridae TaxID=7739 RepID=A0A9J7N4P4_BRAFL|nr:lactadherin-like [Branchiostoma floridae]
MESGTIPDDRITASSFFGPDHEPYRGRLNGVAGESAWVPRYNTIGQWLQVDLGKMKNLTGTIIQGRQNADQWVTSYKLQYSTDGTSWTTYADSDGSEMAMVFKGNADRSYPESNLLTNPVDARYVRFLPQSWYRHISMRVEVLSCDTECSPDVYCVALGKTASQTSTVAGGVAYRAIDGITEGIYSANSCTHTAEEANATWWVDLGRSYPIDRVVIFNRQDCCSERINPFNIHIGDSDQVSMNPKCGGDHQIDVNRSFVPIECQAMTGRYVAVRLPGPSRMLSLCEVQIFGSLGKVQATAMVIEDLL